jgi:hypothetical protein
MTPTPGVLPPRDRRHREPPHTLRRSAREPGCTVSVACDSDAMRICAAGDIHGSINRESSRRSATRARPTSFIEAVDDVARLRITKQEATALRKWGAARGDRVPRWLARMQKAARLVAAAIEIHGRERYDLLVEAAKIMVALREPRTDRVPFERLTFQRSEWLLEVAIGKLGGCVGCLAMGASTAEKRLYARVKRAVNTTDPMGLLRAGAPDDEYHAEIDEITHRLADCRTHAQTLTTVHRVFAKWFGGEGCAGPRRAYAALARGLYAARRDDPAPRARRSASRRRAPARQRDLAQRDPSSAGASRRDRAGHG